MKKIALLKRFTGILISMAMVTSCLYVPGLSRVVWADDDLPENSQEEILDEVSNLHWVDGSRASLSWDSVDNANYYIVSVSVYRVNGTVLIDSVETGTSTNEIDVQQEIHSIVQNTSDTEVLVSACVSSQIIRDSVVVNQSSGIESDTLLYDLGVVTIPTPTNLTLSDDYILEFDCDLENPVEIVDCIYLMFNVGGGHYTYNLSWNDGSCSTDLSSILGIIYRQEGCSGTVDISCAVSVRSKNASYANSEYSSFSNTVSYDGGATAIPTPTNLTLTDNYILEFDCDLENPEEIVDCIYLMFNVGGGHYTYNLSWNDGSCSTDLSSILGIIYRQEGCSGTVDISCAVSVRSKNTAYANSAYSGFSNAVGYNPLGFSRVESIELTPESPVVCIGHSIHLGKTIYPIDAYYNTIEWSCDNSSVLTVDGSGMITAIGVGTANVTARIGNAVTTVSVNVYSISSNLNDADENQDLISAAGTIIDDIVNSDNPDISNTDISEENIDTIRDELQVAIANGDSFHTDVVATQRDYDSYRTNWWQIQQVTRSPYAQFEGAYNIDIEMYHRENNRTNHHIGNITQLDNAISFTCDLPNGMRLGNVASSRRFVLVRVHRYNSGSVDYRPVNYVINSDGTFTATSDLFSDFIWCSIEDYVTPDINVVENTNAIVDNTGEELVPDITSPTTATIIPVSGTTSETQTELLVQTEVVLYNAPIMPSDEVLLSSSSINSQQVVITASGEIIRNEAVTVPATGETENYTLAFFGVLFDAVGACLACVAIKRRKDILDEQLG